MLFPREIYKQASVWRQRKGQKCLEYRPHCVVMTKVSYAACQSIIKRERSLKKKTWAVCTGLWYSEDIILARRRWRRRTEPRCQFRGWRVSQPWLTWWPKLKSLSTSNLQHNSRTSLFGLDEHVLVWQTSIYRLDVAKCKCRRPCDENGWGVAPRTPHMIKSGYALNTCGFKIVIFWAM